MKQVRTAGKVRLRVCQDGVRRPADLIHSGVYVPIRTLLKSAITAAAISACMGLILHRNVRSLAGQTGLARTRLIQSPILPCFYANNGNIRIDADAFGMKWILRAALYGRVQGSKWLHTSPAPYRGNADRGMSPGGKTLRSLRGGAFPGKAQAPGRSPALPAAVHCGRETYEF